MSSTVMVPFSEYCSNSFLTSSGGSYTRCLNILLKQKQTLKCCLGCLLLAAGGFETSCSFSVSEIMSMWSERVREGERSGGLKRPVVDLAYCFFLLYGRKTGVLNWFYILKKGVWAKRESLLMHCMLYEEGKRSTFPTF